MWGIVGCKTVEGRLHFRPLGWAAGSTQARVRVCTRVSAQALCPAAKTPARPGLSTRLLDSGSAGSQARTPGRVQTCAQLGAEAGRQADLGGFLDVPLAGPQFPHL